MLVWLKDVLLWIPQKLYSLLLDGLAFVIEAIPVPAWLTNAPGYLGGIDPTVVYYLEGFAIAEGLSIIFAASLIRFLIRRIPLIG
jgi:hypothetical protein